jgi:hypothetical protein
VTAVKGREAHPEALNKEKQRVTLLIPYHYTIYASIMIHPISSGGQVFLCYTIARIASPTG